MSRKVEPRVVRVSGQKYRIATISRQSQSRGDWATNDGLGLDTFPGERIAVLKPVK